MQPSNLNKQAIQSTTKFIHEHSFSVSNPYQTQDLTMDRCAVFFITAQFHRKLPKNGKYYETYIFTLLPHTHIRVRVTMNGNDTPCYLKYIFWVSFIYFVLTSNKIKVYKTFNPFWSIRNKIDASLLYPENNF